MQLKELLFLHRKDELYDYACELQHTTGNTKSGDRCVGYAL